MGKFYKVMEAHYDMAEFSWAADYASRSKTMAAHLDQLIKSEDTIEEIVKQAAAEARSEDIGQCIQEGRSMHTSDSVYSRPGGTRNSSKLTLSGSLLPEAPDAI